MVDRDRLLERELLDDRELPEERELRELLSELLRDDPSDNVANYAKKDPLSPQLTAALDEFVTK